MRISKKKFLSTAITLSLVLGVYGVAGAAYDTTTIYDDGSSLSVGKGAQIVLEEEEPLNSKATTLGDESKVFFKGTAVGNGASAYQNAVAVGYSARADTLSAIAIGSASDVVGIGSIAVGVTAKSYGNFSIAIGSCAENENTYSTYSVAIGESAKNTEEKSVAIGTGATTTQKNSVAIGANAVANEANTVSFGNNVDSGVVKTRRLTNITDGRDASDAATVGQMQRADNALSDRIQDNSNRIDKVGASAAAMASLAYQPMKAGQSQVAAGVGNYKSKNAYALGLAYQLNNRLMVNAKVAAGTGENMAGIGLSYLFGGHDNQLITTGASVPGSKSLEQAELEAVNESLKTHIADQDAKIADQDAKIADQGAKIAKLEAMIAQSAATK